MPKLVVRAFAVSLDGFACSIDQNINEPFGRNGMRLMSWLFVTKFFNKMIGKDGGEEGLDNDMAVLADDKVGATIMGRNMFGPQRGTWEDDEWKGWWGDEPPYHHPVFVLSHHNRSHFEMKGGTSFTFVSDGIESALKQAFAAAKGKDVRIGGGAQTVKQYWKAGLIDELHLVQVPMLFGQGERLFEGLDKIGEDYEVVEYVPSKTVAHIKIAKKKS